MQNFLKKSKKVKILSVTLFRKYDHGLIEMKFKVKLKSKKQEARKDFSALSNPEVLKKHDEHIEENLKN